MARIDWARVDWGKSNKEIAREIGSSQSYVSTKRRELAPHTLIKRLDYANVDWSKTSKELAKELGRNTSYVAVLRHKYAPDTLYRNNIVGGKSNRKSEPVKFISPNGDIFVVLNINQFVREHKELFAPNDIKERYVKSERSIKKYTNASIALSTLKRGGCTNGAWKGWKLAESPNISRKDSKRWDSVDWAKATKEIAQELGVTGSLVSLMRAKRAPETLLIRKNAKKKHNREKYDWLNVDWNKTNAQICRELGASKVSVKKARMRYTGKSANKNIDWSNVDWTQDNLTLANKLQVSLHTVEARRKQIAKQKWQSEENKVDRRYGRKQKKKWRLSHHNHKQKWTIDNISKFVRENEQLFEENDVIWKDKSKTNPREGKYCNAIVSLTRVALGRAHQWKGWVLVRID